MDWLFYYKYFFIFIFMKLKKDSLFNNYCILVTTVCYKNFQKNRILIKSNQEFFGVTFKKYATVAKLAQLYFAILNGYK